MASNFIPMLSSSPPPLDENGSFDDEDDEFGDFTGAGVKVLDSPLASPVKSNGPSDSALVEKSGSSKKVTWDDSQHNDYTDDGTCEKPRCTSNDDSFICKSETIFGEKIVVFSEDVEQFNCDEDEIDFNDEKPGLSAKYSFTHSEQHDNTSQESVTDSGLCSSSQRSETSPLPPGEAIFSELSPETETEENRKPFQEHQEDSKTFYTDSDSSFNCDLHPAGDELVYDNFDDNTTPVNEEVQTFDDSYHVSESSSSNNDFQDFSVPPVVHCKIKTDNEELEESASSSVLPILRTERFESDDFDDFADFTSAQAPIDSSTNLQVESLVSGVSNDSDGFADFSQASFENSANAEESEWANFTTTSESLPGARTVEDSAGSFSGISQQVSSGSVVAQAHLLLGSAFPGASQVLKEMKLTPTTTATLSILGVETSQSLTLWRQLEDLDESVSLQFQWSGSQIFQTMLRSLNIDSRNVLHNPSVPLFALGLGLLEPVRLAQCQETPAHFTPDDSEQAEELIPPAQFDWSSSGLVNPLDPSQANSTLLNLDFFSLEPSSSTGKMHTAAKTSSLEEELLRMDPVSLSPSSELTSQAGGDLVRKLLSSVPASSSVLHPLSLSVQPLASQQLSSRALGLLDLLPDLSFMQAKVLMFPIRGTLDS